MMVEESSYSRRDRDAAGARPSQQRQCQHPRPSDDGDFTSNAQFEFGELDQEVALHGHRRPADRSESQSETDHGEEAVEFEVSEDDLTDLFSRPQPPHDSTGAREEERKDSDAMLEDSYAWNSVKSGYKSETYDVLPSHFSTSEDGKLGRVPVPALFMAETPEPDPTRSFGVFKWLHLENTNMSFEAFRAFAMQAEGLEGSDREQLKRLLIEVYSTYDSGNKDNRYLKPGVEASCKVRADSPPSHKSIAWSCVPYLRIGKHNIIADPDDLSQHPPWGLLQWHYNDFNNRRNLDLDQTVCRFQSSSDIVQIDQLWCITINQGLILTSARCSAETLVGKNSSLRSEDIGTMTTQNGTLTRGLLVHDLGNRVWAFDANQCGTWLKFVAHFRTITEYFDEDYSVFEKTTMIRPKDWFEIHSRAMLSLVRLTVVQRSGAIVDYTTKSVSAHRTEGPDQSQAGDDSLFAKFRVFPWLWAGSIPSKDSDSVLELAAYLDHLAKTHPSLLAQVRGDRNVQQAEGTSLLYAEELIKKLHETVDSPQSKGQTDIKARKSFVELKHSIWSSACGIAGFFLPSADNSLLSQRYWTLINNILEANYDDCTIELESLATHLKRLSKKMIELQQLLHPSSFPVSHTLELPAELGLMWTLILKALVTAGKLHYSSYQVADNFRQCGRLLKYARRKLLQALAPQDLARAEIVLPISLLGVVLNTLVQDIKIDVSNNLTSTYSQYSDQLELDILKSRGDREHHAQFTRVSHELSVMRDIAASQIKVLEELQRIFGTEAGGFAAEAIGVHGPETGLEYRLLHRARRTAQAGYKQYMALMKEFEDLKTENERMVKMKKDTRETASVIFAIVSTIFLPLTAVASVLGMNTSDIRDMKQSQWIFWIIGIPLAVVTGLLCLAAVDRHLISMSFYRLGDLFSRGDGREIQLSRHSPNTPETGKTPITSIVGGTRGKAVDVELGKPDSNLHVQR
ncbi:hypothetical protein FKW77_008205 [Venturia effusa]|uniref:Uncharacterized protein n=1 Tax=Venturia effusa TaxID=50376 RepID=A0A517L1T1_9PEZI|nr:hypothetical protein FKW77_008205 [Venturia effusa]